MKPVLIVENNTNPLSINENTQSKNEYLLGGIFTEFNVKNRNERIYTAEKFLPALTELNERIKTMGVVYGEFDHPDVFDTSLSRASHLVKTAYYVKESNRVDGEIKLLSTHWGKEARSLVDDGCPIFVSSRAAGVTESDGSVSLKKLFTYDIVADPGFASAKMSSINESMGYKNNTNFRIYEVSNESKINELFNMNKNDYITKQQMTDYSKYLIKEIASTKEEVKKAVRSGSMPPKKLEKLFEYYDELNKANSQIVKYLDYLAEKIQIVVNENKELKTISEKLISHNDYLAENIEKGFNETEVLTEKLNKAVKYSEYLAENVDKTISYSEYLAENVEKTIEYSEYLAENVDKTIEYSEYLAENVDKTIEYSEYLAENVDKTIEYSEYLAENVDKTIEYSEYIAENLDKNITYSEYIAENLDNTIAYSEYLAEHVEGNIAYSEYIAEHLDDNIAYSEYLAENVDKSVSYAGMIVEKLNGGKVFESKKIKLPTLEEAGFDYIEDEEFLGEDEFDDDECCGGTDPKCTSCGCQTCGPNIPTKFDDEEFSDEEFSDGEFDEEGFNDEEFDEYDDEFESKSETELSKQIDKLINEAKKRKVSENDDLHFLKFLNRTQVDSYYELSNEEQEQVKVYINEKSYFSGSDVLKLISEALAIKNETLEERLTRLMPENIKPIWNQLNESAKKSILSQARLYPTENLDTESKVEHFWSTRNLKKNESVTKKMVDHQPLIQEDKLSENEMTSILERFRSI